MAFCSCAVLGGGGSDVMEGSQVYTVLTIGLYGVTCAWMTDYVPMSELIFHRRSLTSRTLTW